jgi:hypothetical protein
MGALKEYHWDAKGSTYGNLLIRIGEGGYIGGDTLMVYGLWTTGEPAFHY